jgi:hypothetical protein
MPQDDELEAPRTDDLLNLTQIGALAGVGQPTAKRWHEAPPRQGAGQHVVSSPLRAVAEAMGINVPEAEGSRPRYPREVVVAFLQATGYMDKEGAVVQATRARGWKPVEPTLDPRPVKQPARGSGKRPFTVDEKSGRRPRYYVPHAAKVLELGSPEGIDASMIRGEMVAPDGFDEFARPFWFLETLEDFKATAPKAGEAPRVQVGLQGKPDDLLSLSDIAKMTGVARGTPQKWHSAPRGRGAHGYHPVIPSPLRKVAKDMGVEVPEAEGTRPKYPRKVVVAFLKAIGYMDKDGALVPEIQQKGPGRWTPVEPTIDPRPVPQPDPASGERLAVDPTTGGRWRYYVPHTSEHLGFPTVEKFEQALARGRVVEPVDYDELGRPYWFFETLENFKTPRQQPEAGEGTEGGPDGYTADGQPYRLI